MSKLRFGILSTAKIGIDKPALCATYGLRQRLVGDSLAALKARRPL